MAYSSFWSKQIYRSNGFIGLIKLLFNYIRIWKTTIPGIIVAAPIIILIRLIRPFIFFRFGNLNSGRIGHWAQDVELYLSEKELELHPNRSVDLFSFGRPPCNKQFAKMCEKKLFIRPFYRYLWMCNEIIPFGSAHTVKVATIISNSRDVKGYLAKTKPHLSFNEFR